MLLWEELFPMSNLLLLCFLLEKIMILLRHVCNSSFLPDAGLQYFLRCLYLFRITRHGILLPHVSVAGTSKQLGCWFSCWHIPFLIFLFTVTTQKKGPSVILFSFSWDHIFSNYKVFTASEVEAAIPEFWSCDFEFKLFFYLQKHT